MPVNCSFAKTKPFCHSWPKVCFRKHSTIIRGINIVSFLWSHPIRVLKVLIFFRAFQLQHRDSFRCSFITFIKSFINSQDISFCMTTLSTVLPACIVSIMVGIANSKCYFFHKATVIFCVVDNLHLLSSTKKGSIIRATLN